MNVSGDTKIYRKDFDGRPSYSRAIYSQEYKDGKKGDWITTFENVQFPKGTNIPDRTMVRLKGFEAVYKSKDGIKRKLVVTEYEVMDPQAEYAAEEYEQIRDDDLPF